MKNISIITIVIAVLLSAVMVNAQNYCLDFDGVDDYVGFSNPISLTGNYTIEAWFNTSTQDTNMDLFAGSISGDHGILLEQSIDGTFRFILLQITIPVERIRMKADIFYRYLYLFT